MQVPLNANPSDRRAPVVHISLSVVVASAPYTPSFERHSLMRHPCKLR
jgi:hypothetical protein